MTFERLSDLTPDGEHAIEGGHRILEDHRDPTTPHIPEASLREHGQVRVSQVEPTRCHSGALRSQPHQREGGHALAGSRFADDRDGLAALDGQIQAVDGRRSPRADLNETDRPSIARSGRDAAVSSGGPDRSRLSGPGSCCTADASRASLIFWAG